MSLSIGITCYPTFGGSGVLATELGMRLAHRGHRVHFICTDLPRRLDPDLPNIEFHRVESRDYPVFPHTPYSLALASKMVDVANHAGLDLIHAHYAVPHATSAWMAREIVPSLKIVTTLHGTDITLVGSDPSYLPITRHSMVKSDALTAPSAALRDDTYARFGLDPELTPIEVIPNFIDTDEHTPLEGSDRPALMALFGPDLAGAPVIAHVSNFRPVKRVDRVIEIFARIVETRPCGLLLVGDGPERAAAEARVAEAGLSSVVRFVGALRNHQALLRECAVFLLPSETESFGLAALEALACGVPVVASAVGGLPEVVQDGLTGILCAPDDTSAMARATAALLHNPDRRGRMGREGREDAIARFRVDPLVDRYEAVYRRLLDR
ncbi:MAG: N-acetyl-alpha-D-glucosaminyl L-malate synthase BshA [Myxococcota bacterium]